MAMADQPAEEMPDTELVVGETDAGEPYTLPVEEVLTGRAFVTGKSGAGKSNTGSVIAEELLDRGHPLLIVDVEGEYWGLKEQFEILHVGATDECDLQVGPEHAGKLAELALEQRVPIILDVSGYLDEAEADELVRAVAEELFVREQEVLHPFLLLVEEVHEYVPEGGGLDAVGQMLIKVAKRGRKRGLGIAGLSQRPADVKKDFITQADLLVWHRLTWDNDTSVVKRVVNRETADAVEDLRDGEAFVQADWAETDIERVQFRRKTTFDAGQTPGLDDVDRPELKSIGEDLVGELEEISEQHERRQDRIAELEAELEAKDEKIAELEEELDDARDLQRLGEAFIDAAEGRGEGGGSGEVDRELLEEKNDQIHTLESELEDVRGERDELVERVDELEAEVEKLQSYADRVEQAEAIEEQLEEAREVLGVEVTRDAGSTAADDRAAELQARIDDLEAENERLHEELDEAGGVVVPTDYEDFVNEDVVQAAIDEATEKTSASPRYVKGVVAAIIQAGGPVDYDTIAERLGVSTTSDVSKAASTLEALGVLERVQQSPAKVDFDLDGVAEIKEQQRRREQAEAVMEDL